jgi:hypothetical protein
MHDHGGRGTPARPPRRWRRPRLPVLVGALALTLAVAACGGGGKSNGVASLSGSDKPTATTSPGGSSDPKQAALAFAKCMRQHGIDMPDPQFDANGRITQQYKASPGKGPNDPKFKAAQEACKKYMPNGGNAPKPNPQEQQQMLQFARCMRQHGINIPDPNPNGGGIDIGPNTGVRPDDPKFKAAQQACQQYQPNGGKGQTTQSGGGGGQ